MDSTKRVLIVSYSFAGYGANTLRYRSLSEYLVIKGHSVDVIGKQRLVDTINEDVRYYQISKAPFISTVLYCIVFGLRFLSELRDITVWSYFKRIGLSAQTYAMIKHLFKYKSYDVCLVGILPWAYYIFIPLLSKHVRTITDIGDPLYKNAVLANSSSATNLSLESMGLKYSSHIITMNEPTIPIMDKEMGIPSDKISFIPPAMNVASYQRNIRTNHSIDSKSINLLYIGSLYKGYRDILELDEALRITSCFYLDVYSRSSYRLNDNPHITFNDAIPHRLVSEKYRKCDIILFVDNSYGYQVPSKIFEILAQNKPILFLYDDRNTYLYDMLANQTGIFFSKNEKNAIVDTLITIQKLSSIEVCYTIDLQDYSEDVINKRIQSVLFSS